MRSIEAAAIAGLAYAALYAVSLVLLTSAPSPSVPEPELTSWYSDPDNRNRLTVGLALSVASSVAFLWFVAVIRRRVGEREDKFFATVFLSSGILVTGISLVAASVVSSPSATIDLAGGRAPDASLLGSITGLGRTLFFVVLLRLQAVFVVSTSTLAMRTAAFSRYLSYIGYATALTMFIMPIATEPVGFAFPLWVAILSLALIARRIDVRAP